MSQPNYKQWEIIFLEFGEYINKYQDNTNYKKADFAEGVNLGNEFSEPHMAIIVSPNALNNGGNVTVVPITNFTRGDERHWDKIVLEQNDFNFLSKKSSIHLGGIRSISKDRVIRMVRPFINRDTQKEIRKKMCSFVGINIQ